MTNRIGMLGQRDPPQAEVNISVITGEKARSILTTLSDYGR